MELTLGGGTPVTVNRSLPEHQTGDPDSFRYVHTVGGTDARWLHVSIKASLGGIDITRAGFSHVPPSSEALDYDEDGNLTSTAEWTYTWDAENRLTVAEQKSLPVAGGLTAPARKKLEFDYDYKNRRISKRVYQSSGGGWSLTKDLRFVYDGWQMIAELDHTFATGTGLGGSAVNRTFLWGPDLSGSMTGAGGVGGLLSTTYQGITYQACSDANGNVTGLVPVSGTGAGTLVARFDYDPFGNRVTNAGPSVELCPFGFSSKYLDVESGMAYYGYRYYLSALGRWLNRDPIGEQGGVNLYGMAGNAPVNRWDYLGLASSAYDAIATVRRTVGNPFGTYGTITIKAVAKGVPDFTALTIELPYGRYNAGGTSGESNFPVRSSATGYLRRRPNLASSKSVSADSSVPAQVLGSWSGAGSSGDNAEVALNSSFWQGQGEVYIHAGQYPTHSTFCVLVGSSYIQGKHLLPDFPSMSNWPASRNAAPGTLITAMAAVAQSHGNVNPEQFVWNEFGREDALQTQYRMNLWIAELEERLCKRGASKKHENEPIMMIRVNIDDSCMNYSSQLIVYP